MKAALISTKSPEWRATLRDTSHDFYHEPGYVEVSARNDGGEPCAVLVVDDRRTLLLPLVLRPLPGGRRDATSPYGFAGPIVAGDGDPSFLAAALSASMDVLRDEGIVSVFIRCHPLLNRDIPDGEWTVVTHADTVSVDLTLAPDEQWQRVRRNHRQQIRQAIQKGYVARIDDAWQQFDAFKTMYRATMERVGAHPYYRFDDRYFEGLRDALGDDIHLACASLDRDLAAACLFMTTCGIVEMHLIGHDDRFRADRPMKMLIDHVRQWAAAQCYQVLHLGGGLGGCDDSLLHFKAGFSDLRQPFRTLRLVADPETYRSLVATCDPSLDPNDTRGRFPLYR